jgi:hypothetical protein
VSKKKKYAIVAVDFVAAGLVATLKKFLMSMAAVGPASGVQGLAPWGL